MDGLVHESCLVFQSPESIHIVAEMTFPARAGWQGKKQIQIRRYPMRFLLKVTLPAEQANEAIVNGRFAETISSILEEQKPEAAYFTEIDGQRTATIFVNLEDVSEIVKYAEPWWMAFGGSVEWHPAMTPEDLSKAGRFLERAADRYGRRR
jgi:hypothetical protein